MLNQEYLNVYRALRKRGLSLKNAHRTLKRGADVCSLAIALRDALGQDGAVALVTGLLEAPYGAQRAAEVLRRFAPGAEFPGRCFGGGVHAGRFYTLLRRVLRALPYVGNAPITQNRNPGDVLWEAMRLLRENKIDLHEVCYFRNGTALEGRVVVRSRTAYIGPGSLTVDRRVWDVLVAVPGGKVLLVVKQDEFDRPGGFYRGHAFVVRALVETDRCVKFPQTDAVLCATGHCTVK
ncbi:hypothetical protein EDD75_0330 [Thermodesulfitimonas autotrophica]|uniref:Uncharacterized protein n=1 Tax=Thermodesulfitimonas autotrophica TaxID=1894989 RepID=A0A3N5AWZ5_9THEO|nr:hypothetical protein [Thermodesulfitimonas autotrophica]RPF49514.1 hypothetical protein EDD75_0330 [Thermodesulfitimonas autotrophica]